MIIIGHRGAPGYEPENTLLSFKKALFMGADIIEMDIHACKTGELIIIHDLTVDRTTNGKGYISNMTFEELRSLDAGKGEKIPSLEEVLYLIGKNRKINLELKGEDTAEPVAGLLETFVRDKEYNYRNFYISSFNHYLLQRVGELIPKESGIKISPLIGGIPIGLAEFAVQLNAHSINISTEFATKELVNDAHRRGMKVFAYTVNDTGELDRMRSLGIDGIFTDYPDIK